MPIPTPPERPPVPPPLKVEEENLQLEAEVASLREFFAFLSQLVEAVDSPKQEADALSLLEGLLDHAILQIGARDASLLVPDDVSHELVFVLVRGGSPKQNLVGMRLPPATGIAGWVAKNKQPAIVNNVPVDDRFYPQFDATLGYRTNALLAAPLLGGGRVLGVVEVINKTNGKLFSRHDQLLLSLMCRFAGELINTVLSRDPDTQSLALGGSGH